MLLIGGQMIASVSRLLKRNLLNEILFQVFFLAELSLLKPNHSIITLYPRRNSVMKNTAF